MYDIVTYGNLVVDTVYDGYLKYKRLGGIANVWNALKEINTSLRVEISPCSYGEAIIYVDRVNNERVSNAVMATTPLNPKIFESNISHIAYLNHLPNADFVFGLPGIISADTCSGRPPSDDLLAHCDFLFVSDDDLWEDLQSLMRKVKGTVILHSPKGSVYSLDGGIHEHKIDDSLYIHNANVLGAGDIFAAAFLSSIAASKTIEDSIKYAHDTTSTLLTKKCL